MAAGTALDRTAPSLSLMYSGSVLTGLGTMLLGPILPLLAHRWGLTDAQGGTLLLAQFCGAFVGGVTVTPKLRRDLLLGFAAAGFGLLGFALAPGLWPACAAIAIGGAGIGRTITVTNVIAGRRFAASRGNALMRLNFVWSFGAMLSPILAALLTPRFALEFLLEVFAFLFLFCALAQALQTRGLASESVVSSTSERVKTEGMATSAFLFFCGVMVLYGGLETCLSGWLTTFALRYGQTGGGNSLALSQYTFVLLLMGLTGGRAVASFILTKMHDATLQRVGLGLAAVFTAALATAHSAGAIAVFAVLLGLSLSPVFPATFSIFIGRGPSERQAGLMIAASAIGAAALPWLMGVVSTRANSLQVALALPFAAAIGILVMSLSERRPASISSEASGV
ncbi:Fucose permease [Granulicella rosea]|uniref:Fucose permease n=2 Tax=Granulicella rosea TaxID=474952 RepID=A0A239EWR6_9BACT|nr:Fucose permease [Granulicella rosea]